MVKDRKAWHVAVHGVEKRWTQLSHWKTNEWQGHSNYFGKMVEISRNSTTTRFLIFYGWPWKMVPLGVSFSLQMCYNEHMLRLRSQFSSVAQSCLTLCDPMDCSTPGFPVYHQLLELTQTHVHQVSDAVQPSHPLSSPSPPAFNLCQHQGLFQ